MILRRHYGSSEILLNILYFISQGTSTIFSYKMFIGQRKTYCTGWVIALAQNSVMQVWKGARPKEDRKYQWE